MALPVSPAFDVFDWNARARARDPVLGELIDADGTGLLANAQAHGSLVAKNAALLVAAIANSSVAPVTTTCAVTIPSDVTPNGYTLEMEVTIPSKGQETWTSLDDRIFLGVQGLNGYSYGVLLSSQQILLATGPADTQPRPLHGAAADLFGASGQAQAVTIRLLVDPFNSRVTVYLRPSVATYDADGVLPAFDWRLFAVMDARYTVTLTNAPAPVSQFICRVTAPATQDRFLVLESLRLSRSLLVPYQRPVAVADVPDQVPLSGSIQLGSLGSKDPAGLPVTSTWAVSGRPAGSQVAARGILEADGTLRTLLAPDLPGVYQVSLTVDNGILKSDPLTRYVQAVGEDHATGYVPNMDFVFNYLGDYWQIVGGTNPAPSVWAALAQVVAGDIEQIWQRDYSKSIRDISRKYARRWMDFQTQFGADEVGTYSLVLPPVVAQEALSLRASLEVTTGTTPVAVSELIDLPADAVLGTHTVLYRSTGGRPEVRRATVQVGGAFPYGSIVVQPPLVACRELQAGTVCEATDDPSSLVLRSADIARVSKGDFLELILPDSTAMMLITAVDTALHQVTVYGTPVVAGLVRWRILDGITLHRFSLAPHFDFGAPAFLQPDVRPQFGDLLAVQIADPSSAALVTAYLPIIAADARYVMVDWLDLVRYLNASAQMAAPDNPTVWNERLAAQVVTNVLYCVRCTAMPRVPDLEVVTTLGTTLERRWYQGREYVVENGVVRFLPTATGTASLTGGLSTVPWPADLQAVQGAPTPLAPHCLYILEGVDAGVYSVGTVPAGISLPQSLVMHDTAPIAFPLFHAGNVPPARLWSELVYLDNWATIQANFGVLVGLSKEDLARAEAPYVDYLQTVKSLCIGFVMGPSVENIGRIADAFSGLPVTEHQGQVVENQPPSDQPGVIIVQNVYGRKIAYPWPVGAELALNPKTGNVIQSFPILTDYASMTAEDALVAADATVPPYTRLLRATRVLDHVGAPEELDSILNSLYGGEGLIRRYHTTVVTVPLDVVGSTAALALMQQHLTAVRPADTTLLVLGTFRFSDHVTVTDTLSFNRTLQLLDTPGTPPVVPVPGLTDGLFPVSTTTAFADGQPFTDADAIERYQAGYAVGLLDDYSGSGSWNDLHSEVDQANQMSPDIDVLNSYVWVPITRDTAGPQAELDLLLGEELELILPGGAVVSGLAGYYWDASPPVVRHVGSPEHPKLPGVFAPQLEHPNTYCVLGFRRVQPAGSLLALSAEGYEPPVPVLAHQARLDGLAVAQAAHPAILLRLRGKQSGATAVPVIVDRADPAFADYFDLAYIFEADKRLDCNPRSELTLRKVVYIPSAGYSLNDVRGLLTAAGSWGTILPGEMSHQVQQLPYVPGTDNEQFVPSFGPGLYTEWATGGTDPFSLDYEDVGAVSPGNPVDLDAFVRPTPAPAVQNAHLAVSWAARKKRAFVHGLVAGLVPAAEVAYIRGLVWNPYDTAIRVEGFFFLDRDTFNNMAPTIMPCAWVAAVPAEILSTWTPADLIHADDVVFVTGAEDVGLLDTTDASQRSDGHVYHAGWLGLTAGHSYYAVVCSYRPYVRHSGGDTVVSAEYAVSKTTFLGH